MKIHNLGSINIDIVYRVPHIPSPGETLACQDRSEGLGGKGANMSIAAAQSGCAVHHYGAVGAEGEWTRDVLANKGVETSSIATVDIPTGHAIIMVADSGENAITLFPGANFALPGDLPERLIENARAGDWLLLQNETSDVQKTAIAAREAGLSVAYAAAPFDANVTLGMLDHVDLLAVNEIEAAQLAEAAGKPAEDLGIASLLITKGAEGAVLHSAGKDTIIQPAHKVEVIDTTGAGDTFFGYYLGTLCQGATPQQALARASAASALQIGKPGAADAIPSGGDVDAFLKAQSV
ncbi:ribokinase [Aliiroseovarius sp. YM-037]|uniref:ribokinase n=1 Tax=Aliiroseovarius sp. YM-037 TaxID=3341728 RepID=UPI003A81027D